MEVQKTINYFQFKRISSNRPVDTKHVKKLVSKITVKDQLHLFPIVVNSKMEIIDGQHRLAAAEILGKYIYYQVDDKISKDDIADVNSTSKNWATIDYINYWTVEKKEGFDKISEFMLDNPLISASTVLMLMSKNETRDLNGLKQGSIDVDNYDNALKVAGALKEYRELINFAYDVYFIRAVKKIMAVPGYNHEQMKAKIEVQRRSLCKCVNVKQYVEMLDEIYNYKMGANRLKLT